MGAVFILVFLLNWWGAGGISQLWGPRGSPGTIDSKGEAEVVKLLSVEDLQDIIGSTGPSSCTSSSDKIEDKEAAVLLFASWDPSSTLLLQTWLQAASSFRQSQRGSLSLFSLSVSLFGRRGKAPREELFTAAFDCAQQQQPQQEDSRALCRGLGVTALPALLYFTPQPIGAKHQQQHKHKRLGFFDDEEDVLLHPRATRYKGDLLMREAIVDWLKLLRCISLMQRLTSSKDSSSCCIKSHQLQQKLQEQQQVIKEQQQQLLQQSMELDQLRKQLRQP
ncbi:hypothetical protein, conserved [Eimeria maxima]|uniref:Thioredoxin domain-containing protein n=1 Tax=Eimeria maxima TaxID=5804 RepID=U6MEL8_EIMMA|nr:hypothetical protein, conserved [Eimeria maxima]CDJ60909.1 hypothetical protein, conserved [Eimeria maxima]